MLAVKRILLVLTLVALVGSVAHSEARWTDYSAATFAAAQAAGRTIVVDVHADWCPTCRAQQPILDELASEEVLQAAVFMKVDFDRQKDFLRAYRIPRQSTILVFNGEQEVARSIAETNRDRLRDMVLSAADSRTKRSVD